MVASMKFMTGPMYAKFKTMLSENACES